ncbi:MAG: translocation/assembly module TamB domain-containing protein [Tannerellaceae bacterium]|nr:translocation/assembly module TamB domain-containing protein [Tannerellaceae bacterium]
MCLNLSKKVIKGLKYIVIVLFALVSLLYVMPVVLLNIPYVQRKVKHELVTALNERLHVPVGIGKVSIGWLNRLTAEDLRIEDECGRTLFEADYAAAGFKLFPLIFRGEFVFTGIRLLGFSLHLYKDKPEGRLNLQFVIDAFQGDTSQQSSDIDLQINSVLIRNGRISYDVLSEAATPGRFNPAHTGIEELSANISLTAFNRDSLNARVRRMSFKESAGTGFVLNKLSLAIAGNSDSLSLRDFDVKLAESHLKIARAHIDLSQVNTPAELLTEAPIRLDVAPSEVFLKEFAPFVPAFQNFTDPIELSAEATGYINDINLRQLTLKYSEKMLFIGQMSLKGVTRPDETYLLGEVNKMYITTEGLSGLINNFNARPLALPESIKRLGTIYFTGEISGFFDNLVAYGKLSSAIGSIETDLLFGSKKEANVAAYVRGTVSSSELLINELFEVDNPYGVARFDVSIDAQCPVGGYFSGNIKARMSEFDYLNYRYENLLLSGHFQRNGFDGLLQIDDPNGALYAQGMFRNDKQHSVFKFTADLRHFRPDNLNLYDKLESPEIAVSLQADFTGNSIDNLEGTISIDSLMIHTAPSDFFMKQLKVTASGRAPDKRITIASDLLNGEVSGVYSFATLLPGFLNTFRGYVPALINTTTKDREAQENNFSLLLTIEDSRALSETLKLPLTLTQQARITGFYNNRFNKFRAEVYLPHFLIGQTMFESCYFSCENPLDQVDLKLSAIQYNEENVRNYFDWQAKAKENRIESRIHWANNRERRFELNLGAEALFVEEKDPDSQETTALRTDIRIAESPLIINDSIWQIGQSDISIRKGTVDIRDFFVSHEAQHLYLDGLVSYLPTDTLRLELNQMELSYIFDVLNISALQFGGKATGLFHLNDLYQSRILNGNLYVQDFSFNQTVLGDLNLFSRWDEAQQGILMLGNIYANDSTQTDVNGFIYPVGVNEGLDLRFDAGNLDIAFLTPFLDKVASGIRGRGTGFARLFGSFDDVDIEGKVYVEGGGLGIDFLNTYYTFSDTIALSPGAMRARNITLSDAYGNTGKLNAEARHTYFRDFEFTVDVQANNMLVYNASQKQSPLISGTVFSSGASRIWGNEQLINFDINMRSEPKTAVTFNFMGNSTATAYDFIAFKDANKPATPADSARKQPLQDSGTEIRMNITLDVTPDADLELIMDPMAGDKIKGYGNGSLLIEYGSKTDPRIYGVFNILSGSYNFSLQQLIRKDFKLREGSTVSFRGDPNDAVLNINAIYNVTANIGDLDPSLVEESARTNIPVNCVLLLEGMLQNPAISFDLELPGSNSELERKVKSYANTEDMMTRQIVYLLVLSRFHPLDFAQAGRSNELSAVTSAAISSQISSILSAITDKVQIGTNIRTSQEGFNETEVEMLFSGQLWDSRLLFNGNFGYRNNPNVKNVFVGEFDLEYLLSPSGEFRLKAYNHANDMYRYLKQSLTTQGFGIMYKKDFSTFSELFIRRRRPLLPPADSTFTPPPGLP